MELIIDRRGDDLAGIGHRRAKADLRHRPAGNLLGHCFHLRSQPVEMVEEMIFTRDQPFEGRKPFQHGTYIVDKAVGHDTQSVVVKQAKSHFSVLQGWVAGRLRPPGRVPHDRGRASPARPGRRSRRESCRCRPHVLRRTAHPVKQPLQRRIVVKARRQGPARQPRLPRPQQIGRNRGLADLQSLGHLAHRKTPVHGSGAGSSVYPSSSFVSLASVLPWPLSTSS